MNKKTKGIIAGVAGIALLGGGATFATWSDLAEIDGGTITSGKFLVQSVGTPAWYDISADRADAVATNLPGGTPGHAVTSTAWKMVPGDVAAAAFQLDVQLEGDNLVADLALANVSAVVGSGATVTYDVYKAGSTTPITVSGNKIAFAAHDAAAGLKTGKVVVDSTAAADVVVVVRVAFAADETNLTGATVVDLSDVGVTLTQARATAPATTF